MNEYSIGEVSSLLNLSRDMIRYYEKQGAIHSKRNEANNYRTYDTMEIFWLMEAVQHKSWGIPISEITNIRHNQYTVSTEEFLTREIDRLEEGISYQSLLAERLRQLQQYLHFGTCNIGNFWIEEMPATFRFHLVRGHGGDYYERINLSDEISRFSFSDRIFPFFTSGLTVGEGYADWEITIQEFYLFRLFHVNSPEEAADHLPDNYEYIPSCPALCTHLDIGEIGHFDPNSFDVIMKYAVDHGYKCPDGARIRGLLLGRGYENGHFRRILRLYLPVII